MNKSLMGLEQHEGVVI